MGLINRLIKLLEILAEFIYSKRYGLSLVKLCGKPPPFKMRILTYYGHLCDKFYPMIYLYPPDRNTR